MKLSLENLERIKETFKERNMFVELIDTLLKNEKIFELISLKLEVNFKFGESTDYVYIYNNAKTVYIYLSYADQKGRKVSYGKLGDHKIKVYEKICDNIIDDIINDYSITY